MPLEEPGWWYGSGPRVMTHLLGPLGYLYGAAAKARYLRGKAYRSRLPVVCISNFTAGGTGKTPLTLHLARDLAARGHQPVALTRGYGGSLSGPYWIDGASDTAQEVGDEALLLAAATRTMLARNRPDGARAIETGPHPATVILMDDGLQNPSLEKDLVIAVVNGLRGFGNGRVIPAGPLRAPLAFQLELADAIVVNEPKGSDGALAETLRREFAGAVLRASTEPAGETGWLADRPVLAWAGIAAPERFFKLLAQLGADVRIRRTFKDHHPLSEPEAAEILAAARASETQLVTTAKDLVRLRGRSGAAAELAAASRVLDVGLTFSSGDAERLSELVASALQTRRS